MPRVDDAIKLVFSDERGKVSVAYIYLHLHSDSFVAGNYHKHDREGHKGRNGGLTPIAKSSIIRDCQPFLTLMNPPGAHSSMSHVDFKLFNSFGLVLHSIRNHYAQHSIYTYSGIVLIAVNPFQRVTLYGPEIIQAYSDRRRGDLEPHLFAIAEDVYTATSNEGMGQTIIVSGER